MRKREAKELSIELFGNVSPKPNVDHYFAVRYFLSHYSHRYVPFRRVVHGTGLRPGQVSLALIQLKREGFVKKRSKVTWIILDNID